jgi:glucose/arabinose dehydrogenase
MGYQFLILAISILCTVGMHGQSNVIPWTPKDRTELTAVTIKVPSKFSAIGLNPTQHGIRLPKGWSASVFAAGQTFNKPRFMAWGPNSTLFVANMNGNNILAMPDRDQDGVADTIIIAAKGFSLGHDVRFWRDTMFVCQEAGVVKLWRSDTNTLVYDKRVTVVDKASQPNQTGGGHRTRTLVIDTLDMKLYVSVGSKGNADREADRACIEQYNYDGTGRRIYSDGVRNAVGMTLHPRTGRLWANNNGSDNQGNNIPPEWVDIVRDNGFYGYPVGYHVGNWFPFTGDYQDLRPYTAKDSANMNRMAAPAALVDAHSAPMALVFTDPGVTPGYEYGAFMAMRGSWNRTPPSGAKIVFLRFDSDKDTIANAVEDFCTGFITDTNNAATRWARPVGLALGADGSVFVSIDDGKQCILKFTPPAVSGIGNAAEQGAVLRPNPASDAVSLALAEGVYKISVTNAQGSTQYLHNVAPGERTHRIDLYTWPSGVYSVSLHTSSGVRTAQLVVSR